MWQSRTWPFGLKLIISLHLSTLQLAAIRALYTVLSLRDPYLSPVPFSIASPPAQPLSQDFRAPTHDDRGLFITNMSPFKSKPDELSFPVRRRGAGAQHNNQERDDDAQGLLARLLGRAHRDRLAEAAPSASAGTRRPLGQAEQSCFDPYSSISSIEEYESLWHINRADSLEAKDGRDVKSKNRPTQPQTPVDASFPASLASFVSTTNWYNSVNGQHPQNALASSLMAGNVAHASNSTCWSSPSPPLKGDYFGLRFIAPLQVEEVGMYGSRALGNIVGQGEEDLTAESWEVYTLAPHLPGEREVWTRRRLQSPAIKNPAPDIGGAHWHIQFFLEPLSWATSSSRRNADESASDDLNGDTAPNVLRKRTVPQEEDQGERGVQQHRLAAIQEQGARIDLVKDGQEESEGLLGKRQHPADGLLGLPADGTESTNLNLDPPDHILGIKLVSRDRKGQTVRVCGWEIEDLSF